jgi:glycine cleavage system T protein
LTHSNLGGVLFSSLNVYSISLGENVVNNLFSTTPLEEIDHEIDQMIKYEVKRQQKKIIMIASESMCPPAVREAIASELAHIYAEGYPSPRTLLEPADKLSSFQFQLANYRRYSNRRYYKGCEYVDIIESTLRRRTAEVFANQNAAADEIFVNTQPLSGAAANNAVYNAFVKPGDTVMGPALTNGGHLTHGSEVNRSGMSFNIVPYEVSRSGKLDYEEIEKIALEHKPKMMIGGFSAYPFDIDWKALREIADKVDAILLADIAHLAGMVAAGQLNNPVGTAHVVSFTTHKTLCGPRGAMLLSTHPEIAKKVDMGVFPGEQGGPHIHQLAAKAVAMKIAASDDFKTLQKNVIANAAALAEGFKEEGLTLAYGGTNTHMCLIDLRKVKTPNGLPLTGEIASRILDLSGIVCNKNTIFQDTNAVHPSGLRFGTTWATQLGLGQEQMKQLAKLIAKVLTKIQPFSYIGGQIDWGRGKIEPKIVEDTYQAVQQIIKAEETEEPKEDWNYPHFNPMASESARSTPLASLHKSQAVKLEEKDGWLVPVGFGDVDREKTALEEGAALIDEGGSLLIEVGQGRAGHLLECACTSKILSLADMQSNASLLLDSEGQPLAKALAIKIGKDECGYDRFILKVQTNRPERILNWLRGLSDGYFVHDQDLWLKCEGPAVIEDLARPSDGRPPMTCLGLRGPKAEDVLAAALEITPPAPGGVIEKDQAYVICRPDGMIPGFDLLIPVSKAVAFWSNLMEAGAQPTGHDAYAQFYDFSSEISPSMSLLSGDLAGRIDLSKPFFIGQKTLDPTPRQDQDKSEFTWEEQLPSVKKTCLYDLHENNVSSKHIVPFAGWMMPVMFSSILDEHQAVRSKIGLFDASHMGVLEISGPFAERFLDLVTTNYVPMLMPNQAHYSYILDHDGRCIDDVIVYRLEADKFMMVVNAANEEEVWSWLQAVSKNEVLLSQRRPNTKIEGEFTLRNLKDPTCGDDRRVDLAIQGPNSLQLLNKLCDQDSFFDNLKSLNKFELASGSLAGTDVLMARTGYTGEEIGFEIFCHPNNAPKLWQKLIEDGEQFGLMPAGLGARDSLRTEAGFPLHGNELAGPHKISPLESGYGSYIKLHKPFFIGRDACLEKHQNRERAIIRFAIDEKGGKVIRAGNPVLASRKNEYAGVVTSAVSTQTRQVGLALVDAKFNKEGNKIQILPLSEGDKAPPSKNPLELESGDWMTIPRKATILSRFMKPDEESI